MKVILIKVLFLKVFNASCLNYFEFFLMKFFICYCLFNVLTNYLLIFGKNINVIVLRKEIKSQSYDFTLI